ncbi:hypothetical protein H4219_005191 [Mycoemilia scoparia]|uniref:Uncharacterized protein n=1 Tax=Mycoemilia scoparia TaxID=417184 RepID=A0A9W7ZX51_9FUNG|nr:hypothetical protein H4219_005191 [Mycoemilia scoparia]
MDKQLPYHLKWKICELHDQRHNKDYLDDLKLVSVEWNEIVLAYHYRSWIYYEHDRADYKIAHKYLTYAHVLTVEDELPDNFFATKCPRLTDLQIYIEPEFMNKLSGYTKLHSTITKLRIYRNIESTDFPVLEPPMLINIISPLCNRLTTLELGTIAHLPSLSLLLERLPSLETLILLCCTFEAIDDIFVKKDDDDQSQLPIDHHHHTNSNSLSSSLRKAGKISFYNLKDLSIGKIFASKAQFDNIKDKNLIFNTELIPNLSDIKLIKLNINYPNPTIPNIELQLIPHIYLFTSATYQAVTKLKIYTAPPQLTLQISDSCPNLKELEITTNHDDNQINTITAFKLTAELFSKLANLKIGIWRRSARQNVSEFYYDFALYSEALEYFFEGVDFWDVSQKFKDIQLGNNNNNNNDNNDGDMVNMPLLPPRFQIPLAFDCANTLRRLHLNSGWGVMSIDVLFPLAQFTNLEYLFFITSSNLDGIEKVVHKIRNHYGKDYKAFERLVQLRVTFASANPNIDQLKQFIGLFPMLRIFTCHIFNAGVGTDKDEILWLLRKEFPHMIINR